MSMKASELNLLGKEKEEEKEEKKEKNKGKKGKKFFFRPFSGYGSNQRSAISFNKRFIICPSCIVKLIDTFILSLLLCILRFSWLMSDYSST